MAAQRYNDIEDKELLQRYYRELDNEWLGILLQRYTMLLLGVCMKYLKNEEDARDSVQQVFLKVIRDLPKYKVDYFKSWLYMVAKNHCLMKLRDKGGYTVELAEQLVAADPDRGGIDAAVEKDRQLGQLEQALKECSPMSDELRKILSSNNKAIPQDKLLDYLDNSLPEQEMHDLEMQMNDDAFISDAAEGLQALHEAQKVPLIVQQLNTGLKKQLAKNKKRRSKRLLSNEGWIYFSIVLLLLLAVIAYVIVRKFTGS